MNDSLTAYQLRLDSIAAAPAERRHEALARCFSDIIDEATEASSINFSGPFAKTDFLLRKHKAGPRLVHEVHSARIHFREGTTTSFDADLRAVRALAHLLKGERIPAESATGETQKCPKSDTCPDIFRTPAGRPDTVRVVVQSIDAGVLNCRTDGTGSPLLRLNVRAGQEYLCDICSVGSQLNLLRPEISGEDVSAEIVIYEPDFLVTVTRIAQCFESYGTDARIGIVKRLMPSAASEAIHLGNFASQLLDEELHCSPGRSYAESVRAFFRGNAGGLVACPVSKGFHAEAMRQRENIAAALGTHMKNEVADFDPRKVTVEPVFFCEALGLQGRMDFLQLDYRVLLEQKSGKGEWPQGDFTTPRHRQPHYVQLLLYMAMIRYGFPDIYKANDRRLHAFLMYSRYSVPLVSPGFAPGLFAEAMEVRNRFVRYHELLADGKSVFLRELTPEALNKRGTNTLWENFSRPQLAAILENATLRDPLASAYYYRMLAFVAKEHSLAKTGNKTKRASGFAALWQCSLADKLAAGNIYAGLSMTAPAADHSGAVAELTMDFADDGNHNMTNFRPGDSVILYSYPPGHEPDARRTPVFRCNVTAIESASLRLTLRFPQSGILPLLRPEGHRWAIEHDYTDSAHNVLYQNVQAFLDMPDKWRSLLLMRRCPTCDSTRTLALDQGDFNDLALRVRRARDLFLIVGPPGTGKTSHGLVSTLREELADPDACVLLLSYTNRAVDEICSRLIEEGLDFLRIGPELACSEESRPHLLSVRAAACSDIREVRKLVTEARIVAATVSSANTSLGLLRMRHFSLAIIDEASQIPEPNLLGLLSARTPEGEPAIEKLVMIGDHKQLPAVVLQTASEARVKEAALRDIGLTDCRISLFERLLRRYGGDTSVSHLLTRQGRMHADIAAFPSATFYGGKLVPVGLPHQHAPLLPGEGVFGRSRLVFIDLAEEASGGVSDNVNRTEADAIASIAAEVYGREPDFGADTLGVIVPYRNQIAAVRHAFAGTGIKALEEVTVDTVERFQGSQRKYIVYGFTVKSPYQLKFLTDNTFTDTDGTVVDRKLNVALTRAREYMALVGNGRLLRGNPLFARLIEHMEKAGRPC